MTEKYTLSSNPGLGLNFNPPEVHCQALRSARASFEGTLLTCSPCPPLSMLNRFKRRLPNCQCDQKQCAILWSIRLCALFVVVAVYWTLFCLFLQLWEQTACIAF